MLKAFEKWTYRPINDFPKVKYKIYNKPGHSVKLF